MIEGDKKMVRIVSRYLKDHNYNITTVDNGVDGTEKAVHANRDYELILLGRRLPYKNGEEVLQEIRSVSNIPVIILDKDEDIKTKVRFLEQGADDYMTFPFDLDELGARIGAALRRCSNIDHIGRELKYKNITIYPESRSVFLGDQKVNLPKKEYAILELMVRNSVKIFSKANLYESVWNTEYFDEEHVINTHIGNLRRTLKKFGKKDYIETVWGIGYRLC